MDRNRNSIGSPCILSTISLVMTHKKFHVQQLKMCNSFQKYSLLTLQMFWVLKIMSYNQFLCHYANALLKSKLSYLITYATSTRKRIFWLNTLNCFSGQSWWKKRVQFAYRILNTTYIYVPNLMFSSTHTNLQIYLFLTEATQRAPT